MVTHRDARPGETLFGGGRGILIPFRPSVPPKTDPSAEPVHPEDEEESPSQDRGWYTDIDEIESTIQDCVEQEESELGRPLTKKERQRIVQFLTPELQDDYEEE